MRYYKYRPAYGGVTYLCHTETGEIGVHMGLGDDVNIWYGKVKTGLHVVRAVDSTEEEFTKQYCKALEVFRANVSP